LGAPVGQSNTKWLERTMCGRFTLTATPEALSLLFPSLFEGLEQPQRYNVAPTQAVLAVRLQHGTDKPEAVNLRWGLIPSWANDPKIGYRTINARLDTAPIKPAFRSAFKSRHCLILAAMGFTSGRRPGPRRSSRTTFACATVGPSALPGYGNRGNTTARCWKRAPS
jgi:putative SOS response-associated peptidase YedK